MLKYDEWLVEYVIQKIDPTSNIHKSVNIIKSNLEKNLGEIIVIPDFEKFVRDDEPEQQKVLFSTKTLHSFNANFTKNGKLYSIDFWVPDKIRPVMTMYIKKGTVDQISKLIPKMMMDPKPVEHTELQSMLTEDENNNKVEVEFKAPPIDETPKSSDDQYEFGDPEIMWIW